jgi:DNA-binding NtrC family response regulator
MMSHFVTLIVENDTLQREAIADLLKGEGLEVVECTTAEAAELVLAATGRELLALVTDLNLDGAMTGAELAEYAKEQYPSLKVIVVSGATKPDLPENTRFLQKPYDYIELLDAVLYE